MDPWFVGKPFLVNPKIFKIFLFLAIFAYSVAIVSEVSAFAAESNLIEVTPLGSSTKKAADLSKRIAGIEDRRLFPSRTGYQFFRLVYQTIGPNGGGQTASGLVILPSQSLQNRIVVYHHGTSVRKADVPSQPDSNLEATVAGLVFGSMGYIVFAPDYLGLGESSFPYHPYLNSETEGTASVDMIRAGLDFLADQGISQNFEIALTGYSQGGHATLAAQKLIEKEPGRVSAKLDISIPMAGPYDLLGEAFKLDINRTSKQLSLFTAYVLNAIALQYFNGNIQAIMSTHYAGRIPDLIRAGVDDERIKSELPENPLELLSDSVIESFKDTNSEHPLKKILRENSVYDWTPVTLTYLVHFTGDQVVRFENSKKALKQMGNKNVFLIDLGENLDHLTGFFPALTAAFSLIELQASPAAK